MGNRIIGIVIVSAWASSMTWLIHRDIWPAWTAQEVPIADLSVLARRINEPTQQGIYDSTGRRIGAIWTDYSGSVDLITRSDQLYLEQLPVVGSALIDATSDYAADGTLSHFEIEIHGPEQPVTITGERFHTRFAIAIYAGSYHQAMELDASAASMLGDCFRPFASLPELHVGQAWRMQVFNPLAVLTGVGRPFSPLLVRVTGKTMLHQPAGPVECFVVEAAGVTAWVDESGTTVAQEVDVPLLGRLTIRDEALDVSYRKRALSLLPNRRGGQQLEDSHER